MKSASSDLIGTNEKGILVLGQQRCLIVQVIIYNYDQTDDLFVGVEIHWMPVHFSFFGKLIFLGSSIQHSVISNRDIYYFSFIHTVVMFHQFVASMV